MEANKIQCLGRVPFETALREQSRVIEALESSRNIAPARGEILLFESEPIITLGRRRHGELSRFRSASSLPVIEVDRGGLETYHGPGQWVLFWVERLENLVGPGEGVACYVRRLLESTQRLCESILPPTVELSLGEGAELGLWIRGRGKLASVGVRNSRGIVTHGIALNVLADAQSFFGIDPCGISNARPAFLADYCIDSVDRVWARVESEWPTAILRGVLKSSVEA